MMYIKTCVHDFQQVIFKDRYLNQVWNYEKINYTFPVYIRTKIIFKNVDKSFTVFLIITAFITLFTWPTWNQTVKERNRWASSAVGDSSQSVVLVRSSATEAPPGRKVRTTLQWPPGGNRKAGNHFRRGVKIL